MNPMVLFGLLLGGSVIYWFSGASMQAVSTGAYRAVAYIKRTHQTGYQPGRLPIEDSKKSGQDLHHLCAKRDV